MQLTKEGTGGPIKAVIKEDGTAISNPPADYTVSEASTDYDDSNVNVTTDGFSAHLIDNTTTEMRPGVSYFFELGIVIPPYQTGVVEVSLYM